MRSRRGKLARLTRRSLPCGNSRASTAFPSASAFLLSKPPNTPLPTVERRVFAGVTQPEMTTDVAKALHRAAALQAVAREILDETGMGRFQPLAGEEVQPAELARSQRAAFGIAVAQQQRWRDDGTALRAWRAAIKQEGVFVLQMPMPEAEVRAFSLSNDPPLIVLNRSDYVRARVFSLMHEYCHVLLGAGGICMPGTGRGAMQATGAEQYCNLFSAPSSSLLTHCSRTRRFGRLPRPIGSRTTWHWTASLAVST